MDDGLQNPTLKQDCGLLVIDGAAGFGNGRVLPAGPLREAVASAASRCTAAVLIGADATGAVIQLPASLPVLRAALVPDPALAALAGRTLLAFAGIGRPDKFFTMLAQAGLALAATRAFPDHHRYTGADLARLRAEASRLGALLVTTPKDHVRLADQDGITAIGVSLRWQDPPALDRLLDQVWQR